jgi:hypothetical protein
LLGEDQASLGRVTSLRRLVVEELTIPDFPLDLPIHNKSFFNRPPEGHLAEVSAFFQLRPDVGLLVAVSREAVRDDPRSVLGRIACHDSSFDGVSAIVEHKSYGWWRRASRPRLSTACHEAVVFLGSCAQDATQVLVGLAPLNFTPGGPLYPPTGAASACRM